MGLSQIARLHSVLYKRLNMQQFSATKNFKSMSKPTAFAHQNVGFNDFVLYFPPGFEKFFLAIYSIFLPYLTGLLFLFLYVAKGDSLVFSSLSDESSFMFSWCIGYECIAALTLLLIVKKAFSFNSLQKNK